MNSEEHGETEVSRFTLDGIIAEMVIEVDENSDATISPSKTLKLDKYIKKSSSLEDKSRNETDDSPPSTSDSQEPEKDGIGNQLAKLASKQLEDTELKVDGDQLGKISDKDEESELEIDKENDKESPYNRSDLDENKDKEYEGKDEDDPKASSSNEGEGSPFESSKDGRTDVQAQEATEGGRTDVQAQEATEGGRTDVQAQEATEGGRTDVQAQEATEGGRTDVQAQEATEGGRTDVQAQEATEETTKELLDFDNLNSKNIEEQDTGPKQDRKEVGDTDVPKVGERESEEKPFSLDDESEEKPFSLDDESEEKPFSLDDESEEKPFSLDVESEEKHSTKNETNSSDKKSEQFSKSNSKNGEPNKKGFEEDVEEKWPELGEEVDKETDSNINAGIKKRGRPPKSSKQKIETQYGKATKTELKEMWPNLDKMEDKESGKKQMAESDAEIRKKVLQNNPVVSLVPVQVPVVSTSCNKKQQGNSKEITQKIEEASSKVPGSKEKDDKELEKQKTDPLTNLVVKKRGRPFKSAQLQMKALKRKAEEETSKEAKPVFEENTQESQEISVKKRGRPPKQKIDIKEKASPSVFKSGKASELVDTPRFRSRTSLQNEKPKVSDDATPKVGKRKFAESNEVTELSEKKLRSVSKPTPGKSSSLPKRENPLLTAKPKYYKMNRDSNPSLGDFPEIKDNVSSAAMRTLRYFHRILYDKNAPKEEDEVRAAILGFRGFSFNRKSDHFEQRQQILTKVPASYIVDMCKVLDLNEDKNQAADILKFLLRPTKSILSPVNPFESFMQPVLKLEKISFDNKYMKKVQEDISALNKRKRFPSIKLDMYVDPSFISRRNSISDRSSSSSVTSERKRYPSEKPQTLDENPAFRLQTPKTAVIKTVESLPSDGISLSRKKQMESKTGTKAWTSSEEQVRKLEEELNANISSGMVAVRKRKTKLGPFKFTSHKLDLIQKRKAVFQRAGNTDSKAREKVVKLAMKIQETENPTEPTSDDDEYIPLKFYPETVVKLEPLSEDQVDEPVSLDKTNEDSSSEVTLSADEAREEAKNDLLNKKQRILYRRVGRPLSCFDKVKENILNGSFSALQRLHILLFGSSDKAENLKGNILAFGGFPFLEGSDEWKQKEFLLSLVAQNTLREYLILLDINYTNSDDQRMLIIKLMKFLAAPSDSKDEGETKVIYSEPTSFKPILIKGGSIQYQTKASDDKPVPAKRIKKQEPKKPGGNRAKKVLMDEAQVRRLEADLAREQRILERERKLRAEETKRLLAMKGTGHQIISKSTAAEGKQTDLQLLNALLQTVRQRRALQNAGAKISVPNKGGHTRLGELANVKFLVVTANYSDLDVLHHLIYMSEANKSRVRKNILDFAGFNFTEDSPAYKDRIDFLTSLGYDISKRIAFLLGLCPFKTNIPSQDMNELIMYFLMAPCQSKQVPIKHLPQTFFGKDMPEELCNLLKKHGEDISLVDPNEEYPYNMSASPSTINEPVKQLTSETDNPRPKAKKSFKTCLPPNQKKGLSPSISTLPLKAPKRNVSASTSLMRNSLPIQLPTGISLTPHTPVVLQQTPPILQNSILNSLPVSTCPQEFFIQQQTPDGKQKTFKLIKLPPNHPLNTVLKNSTSSPKPVALPPAPKQAPPLSVPLNQLPPGLIIFKGSNTAVPTGNLQTPGLVTSAVASTDADKSDDVVVLDDKNAKNTPVECDFGDDEVIELNPLEEVEEKSPPLDAELFTSIQEVIHTANFEDITLRNVIDRVAAQYSDFDLTHRHTFMKECVKKIIMGS